MGLLFDMHVHTSKYSPCSRIDPGRLVERAVKAGLHGLVITEHHYQWDRRELDELVEQGKHTGFVVLSGFEYSAPEGDILVYGLDHAEALRFDPGMGAQEVIGRVHELGGSCVAAHPTRAGLGFDERILTLAFDAIEVRSVNLEPHEQELASNLAQGLGKPGISGSDAHDIEAVGAYATEFEDVVLTRGQLHEALRHGRFQVAQRAGISGLTGS